MMRHTSRPSEMSSTTRATGHKPRNGLTGSPISSSMQATSYMVNNLVITSSLSSSFLTSPHLIIITRVLLTSSSTPHLSSVLYRDLYHDFLEIRHSEIPLYKLVAFLLYSILSCSNLAWYLCLPFSPCSGFGLN